MDKSRPRPHVFVLHVFTLCGFALAQPLYNWISLQPEFLVAHGMGAVELAWMVGLLSFGVPLLVAGGVLILRFTGRQVLWGAQLLVVGLLCGLLALEFLPAMSASLMLALAGLGGLAGLGLYGWAPMFRSVLSVAALAALVFPVLFVFTEPVKSLLAGDDEFAAVLAGEQQTDKPAPEIDVVMVMLDELPVALLLDEHGDIDARHFPNFARLASTSTWYPNAATIYYGTSESLPASLTGRLPEPARDTLPTWHFHPDNLFIWASQHYGDAVKGHEALTGLCPDPVCRPSEVVPAGAETPLIPLVDLAVLYGWRILPGEIASAWLPSVEEAWHEFAARDFTPFGGRDRVHAWLEFVDGIDGGFNFMHLFLPHSPLEYLPDGSRYTDYIGRHGYSRTDSVDGHNVLELQRYMAQARYTDSLLGKLLDQLKASGRYDDTLVVVTADHGRSFRKDSHWRGLDRDNLGDVLGIPLLIKYPGQEQAVVDQRPASLIDIAPTIADVTGRELHWEVAGQSLIGESPARDYFPVSCVGDWSCTSWLAERTDEHNIFWLPVDDLAKRVAEMQAGINARLDFSEALDLHVPASPFTGMLGRSVSDFTQIEPMPGISNFIGPGPVLKGAGRAGHRHALVGVKLEATELEIGQHLMLAVNDRLAGTGAIVTNEEGTQHVFAVLFPAVLSASGEDRVNVYKVWEEDDAPRLQQLELIE